MSDRDSKEGMSLIVKTVTVWLKRFILIFGLYVVLHGHLTPGGGFAGGVVIACAFILLTLAEGQRIAMKTAGKHTVSKLASIGGLIFLGAALTGMALTGIFFRNFTGAGETPAPGVLGGGVIEIYEVGIAIVVSMSLFLVFTMLSARHVAVKDRMHRAIHGEGD